MNTHLGPRTDQAPQDETRRRTVLRASSAISLATIIIDALLVATGVIGWPTAVVLLLAVELPLAALAIGLHVRIFQGARRLGADRASAWESVLAANPLLKLVQVEFAHVLGLPRDLLTIARGAHRGPGTFAYTSGTLTLPIVLTVLILAETAVVHLLVPWAWLRLILLLSNVYAVALVASSLIARVGNPHRIVDSSLRLQLGRHTVAASPLANLRAAPATRREHDWLAVTGEGDGEPVAHLANQFGTNVRLTFDDPVMVREPTMLGADTRHLVRDLHLMVDDPEAFLTALGATRAGAPERAE